MTFQKYQLGSISNPIDRDGYLKLLEWLLSKKVLSTVKYSNKIKTSLLSIIYIFNFAQTLKQNKMFVE